jgi:hypothetical protein
MSSPVQSSVAARLPAASSAAPAQAPKPPSARAVVRGQPAAEPSREAKQRAAAILEVLAGARTPTQAAQALGVSLARYYLLEEKGLAGLLAACEPQPRGPGVDAGRRLAALERDCQRWQRECARQQALVRAAQRTIGLAAPAPSPAKDKGKKRRSRRPVVRALQAATRLRSGEDKKDSSPRAEAAMQS